MTRDDGDWWVLIERPGSDCVDLLDPVHVGGKAAAIAKAEELCLTTTPGSYYGSSPNGREVFRISETSWLVRCQRYDSPGSTFTLTTWFRVSVAELAKVVEIPALEPEPKKKGLFGRR